ncbi:hypothetical protein SAMN05421547_1499, partial [Delftia lacustris]
NALRALLSFMFVISSGVYGPLSRCPISLDHDMERKLEKGDAPTEARKDAQ